MKAECLLPVAALVLSFAASAQAAAETAKPDMPAVLAAIDAADAAALPDDAAASCRAAAEILRRDSAASDQYGRSMGKAVATRLAELATTFTKTKDKPNSACIEAVRCRVRDLYGAILPASRGSYKDAIEYVKAKAETAPDNAKEKILGAAAAMAAHSSAAAGRLARENVTANMMIALSAPYIVEASRQCEAKQYRNAGFWVNEAANYLKDSTEAADGKVPDRMGDAAARMRAEANDLLKNIPFDPEEVLDMIP